METGNLLPRPCPEKPGLPAPALLPSAPSALHDPPRLPRLVCALGQTPPGQLLPGALRLDPQLSIPPPRLWPVPLEPQGPGGGEAWDSGLG